MSCCSLPCNTSSPINNPCKFYPDTKCVVYTGPVLPCIGVTTNERLDSILKKIDLKLCNSEGGDSTITLIGDVTGSGTTTIATSVVWPNGYSTYDSRYFLRVREQDSSPNITPVTTIVLGNNLSMTDDGGQQVTITANSVPSLTFTQVGFGDVSNLMTSSANLTYLNGDVLTAIRNTNNQTIHTGIKLVSNTLSTGPAANQQQWSPALSLYGTAWKSNDSTSHPTGYTLTTQPYSSGLNTEAVLDFSVDRGTGTFASIMTLSSTSDSLIPLLSTGKISASTVLYTPQLYGTYPFGGTITFNNGAKLTTSGNLQLCGIVQSVADNGYRLWSRGEAQVEGGIYVNKINAPVISGVGNGGVSGSTSYTYKVVARLINGQTTEASAAVSTSTGNATLTGGNYNIIAWNIVQGAYVYDIYRTISGGSPSSIGKVGSTLLGAAANVQFLDTGAAGDGLTPPSINTTGNIGIGTATPQAALEVNSTTQGVLFPRMTTTQRNAIISPVGGTVIFNTTSMKLNVFTTSWEEITSI